MATKFSPVVDYELKFVKMQFLEKKKRYHYDNNKHKPLKSIQSKFRAI